MCIELGISLSVFRVASDRDEILEKWNLLSTYNLGQFDITNCVKLVQALTLMPIIFIDDRSHTVQTGLRAERFFRGFAQRWEY